MPFFQINNSTTYGDARHLSPGVHYIYVFLFKAAYLSYYYIY